jgi:hypothetical protein
MYNNYGVTTLNAELGFFLNGTVLSNNSIVVLGKIREGSDALYCLTNRTQCCGISTGGANRGIWKFPNGSNVGEGTTADVYFTRGFSSLPLSRRSSAVGPTGVYTCFIPDAGDSSSTTRTLTITVSASGVGEQLSGCM